MFSRGKIGRDSPQCWTLFPEGRGCMMQAHLDPIHQHHEMFVFRIASLGTEDRKSPIVSSHPDCLSGMRKRASMLAWC